MATDTTNPDQPQPLAQGTDGAPPPPPPAPEPTQPPQPQGTEQPKVKVEDHRGEDVPEHLRAGQQDSAKTDDTSGDPAPKDPIAELEKLDPYGDEKVWVIGKPPELDGEDNEWLKLYQRPLGYMAKFRFFALLSSTIGRALEGGTSIEELLREAGVTDGGRNFSLSNMSGTDLSDMGSVMPVVMRLVAESPDFLLDAYCILLDVPKHQRAWVKAVMEQPYRPDSEQWGLSDDQGIQIIEIAIDQNYDPLREFFTKKFPRIAARVRSQEAVRELPSGQ